MDRHSKWRRVEHDVRQANRRGNGHEAYVLVYIAGRPEPLEVAHVSTRRGDDESWVRFESAADAQPPEGADWLPPACRWVHAPESSVLAVDVAYRKPQAGRQPVGFTHGEAEAESADAELAIH